MSSGNRSRRVQDTFCISPSLHPLHLQNAAVTVSGPAQFGREDGCPVSIQRDNPESRSGHSRGIFPSVLRSEEEWALEANP